MKKCVKHVFGIRFEKKSSKFEIDASKTAQVVQILHERNSKSAQVDSHASDEQFEPEKNP